jgi:hypothetical protein
MQKLTRLRLLDYAGRVVLIAGIVVCLRDLVRGLMTQRVEFPLPRLHLWVERAEDPVLFFASIVMLALYITIFALLLYVISIGLNAERENFRRRDSRPPLDDAVRENRDPTL